MAALQIWSIFVCSTGIHHLTHFNGIKKVLVYKTKKNNFLKCKCACFQNLFLRYQFLIYPMIGKFVTVWYFNTYINHLTCECPESNKHVKRVKPSYTAPFDVLTFDILTWEMVLREVGGSVALIEVFEKMFTGSPLLSSCFFLPHSLFHHQLTFFLHLHWPRAW